MSVANRILDLDVVVQEDATTKGLLGVMNGDMYADFTYPNGTNITHSDPNEITISEIHQWGLTCKYDALFT